MIVYALYDSLAEEFVRSSSKNTKEYHHIKLFETTVAATNYRSNNGMSEYQYDVMEMTLTLGKKVAR